MAGEDRERLIEIKNRGMTGRFQFERAVIFDVEWARQCQRTFVVHDNRAAFVDSDARHRRVVRRPIGGVDRVVGAADGVDLAAGPDMHDALHNRGVVEHEVGHEFRVVTDQNRAVDNIAVRIRDRVGDRGILNLYDAAIDRLDRATICGAVGDQHRAALARCERALVEKAAVEVGLVAAAGDSQRVGAADRRRAVDDEYWIGIDIDGAMALMS